MGRLKIDGNPRRAYQQGITAGVNDGIIATEFFSITAMYNVIVGYTDDDEKIAMITRDYDRELWRIIQDELKGEHLMDNVNYAIAKTNELRKKLGLDEVADNDKQ